jgi:hypothetical protein
LSGRYLGQFAAQEIDAIIGFNLAGDERSFAKRRPRRLPVFKDEPTDRACANKTTRLEVAPRSVLQQEYALKYPREGNPHIAAQFG